MSKIITLDNREKYNKIFSDTVNICLETLSKDHCYHVSRLGCGELISPLVARLSIKLSGYLKEIINEIEMESCDQPVIKIDEDGSVEFNDVNDLRRQLNPLLNVTMKKGQAQQNIEASTNVHKDPNNYVDNNKAGGQSRSSTNKINSVEAIKNKDSVSIELIKKKTCPKAIPLKNICQSSNTINVDKADDNKVLKRVSVISSSNGVKHTPLHQQSSLKCTSGQSEMTQIINMCSSDDDDDEITKKRNNSMTKNHGQSGNKFKKFRPNDNDDSTVKIDDSIKNKLKKAAIYNSSLTYKKLLKAKKKLKINAADKFWPVDDRFRLPIWRKQFCEKYNITGKPSDRVISYFCK
ncbi:uncharacterized protein LOC122847859 [Aphidius gifuensis]|uniref:uncharacterized protein LOC122847859 n=1 Tax=Aphidius gifuensis TaxID=684658 RepID=UPI001CDBAD30|nr:uncharacterized protein LOC122847859 [Aphidius gifuensis]